MVSCAAASNTEPLFLRVFYYVFRGMFDILQRAPMKDLLLQALFGSQMGLQSTLAMIHIKAPQKSIEFINSNSGLVTSLYSKNDGSKTLVVDQNLEILGTVSSSEGELASKSYVQSMISAALSQPATKAEYLAAGTYNFAIPYGVVIIHAVAVGGGGGGMVGTTNGASDYGGGGGGKT